MQEELTVQLKLFWRGIFLSVEFCFNTSSSEFWKLCDILVWAGIYISLNNEITNFFPSKFYLLSQLLIFM